MPFKNWNAADFLAVGLAALCLSMVSKHLLGNDLGYAILTWTGMPITAVGLVLLIRDHV